MCIHVLRPALFSSVYPPIEYNRILKIQTNTDHNKQAAIANNSASCAPRRVMMRRTKPSDNLLASERRFSARSLPPVEACKYTLPLDNLSANRQRGIANASAAEFIGARLRILSLYVSVSGKQRLQKGSSNPTSHAAKVQGSTVSATLYTRTQSRTSACAQLSTISAVSVQNMHAGITWQLPVSTNIPNCGSYSSCPTWFAEGIRQSFTMHIALAGIEQCST